MLCERDENVGVVRELLAAGADINAVSGASTALGLASYFGHLDTVRALLDAGADVNDRRHGYSPYTLACYSDVRELLAARGGVH